MLASLFAVLPLLALVSASPVVKRADSRLIQSGRSNGYCLSVQGGRQAVADGNFNNGTPVTTLLCSVASFWDISPGSGSVVVSGTNYALDIGLQPGNNGPVKVWQSYPGAPQQTWYLTDDNRIAITGGNQCLDQGDNGPQTYQCTTGNTNQVWNVRFNDPPVTPSSSPSSTPTSSSVPSASASPAPGGGQQIHPNGDTSKCLTINSGYAGSGTPVGIANCFGAGGTFDSLQRWDLPTNGAGPVRAHGTDVCLDAGIDPSNGVEMKVWSCGDYPQQTWTYDGVNLKTANNQCLDVKAGSTGLCNKPYCTDKSTQTWECSTNNNPNQIFTV